MPVDLLVHATTHLKAVKGTIQDARDVSELSVRPWGRREGLPNFVRLRIRDADKADIIPFLAPVKNEFLVSQVANTSRRKIYAITIKDGRVLTKFGISKGTTLGIVEALNKSWSARFVSREPDNSRLTITALDTTAQELAKDILDIFEEVLLPRRFHLDPSDVDVAITAGGFVEMDVIQIIPRIVDGLD